MSTQAPSLILLLPLLAACGKPQPTSIPTPVPSAPTTTNLTVPLPVELTRDVIYAKRLQQQERPEAEFKLNVYAPIDPGDWPVVVYAHAMGGTKDSRLVVMRAIAEHGVVAFSIDYPDTTPSAAVSNNGRGFREMTETVACAVRFARAKASDYGGDAAQVILVGFSMGGGVGASVALVGDNLEHQWEEFASMRGGPPRQVDCEVDEGSAHVDAFVGIAGSYDAFVGYDGYYGREWLQAKDPKLWEMFYSSLGQNPDLKVRLLHGENDTTIPFENSVEFDAVLAEAGYDTELIQFDGGHTVPLELTVETVMEVARNQPGDE